MTAATEVEQARRKASGSSFYAGMRVLPKAEREAMFAIYAFCRAVDDIADDMQGDPPARRRALDGWRADIERLYAGGEPGRAHIVAEAVSRFGLEKADFLTVIDGMQMDVDQDIRGPDMATLDLYCDRVASAVGRLSVHVFGMAREPGLRLAYHLGRALQLTNILRDLDEDAAIGRLYLPLELLQAAGLDPADPEIAIADPRVDGACRALAEVAHQHYAAAAKVLAERPAGRLAAPRLMGAVYSRILSKTEAQGWAPPRRRAKLGKGELVWIMIRRGLLA